MNVIICLDDRRGVLFNCRRQSKDRRVIEDIGEHLEGTLYITPFSEKLFSESGIPYVCMENAWEYAGEGDTCFVESVDFLSCLDSIRQITVYGWNRHYPSDVRLELDFRSNGFALAHQSEFVGFSHEKITKEIYKR